MSCRRRSHRDPAAAASWCRSADTSLARWSVRRAIDRTTSHLACSSRFVTTRHALVISPVLSTSFQPKAVASLGVQADFCPCRTCRKPLPATAMSSSATFRIALAPQGSTLSSRRSGEVLATLASGAAIARLGCIAASKGRTREIHRLRRRLTSRCRSRPAQVVNRRSKLPFVPHLTIEPNITLAPARERMRSDAGAAQVLARSARGENPYPEQLSGGQQRAAIAVTRDAAPVSGLRGDFFASIPT